MDEPHITTTPFQFTIGNVNYDQYYKSLTLLRDIYDFQTALETMNIDTTNITILSSLENRVIELLVTGMGLSKVFKEEFEWFCYERDFGRKSGSISIDGQIYILDSIDDFWKVIIALNNRINNDEVIDFIKKRFPHDDNWSSGNCYYFAQILATAFNGRIVYDVIDGHFMCEIHGLLYDYNGINDTTNKWVYWDSFPEYDRLQYDRIVHDCIKGEN